MTLKITDVRKEKIYDVLCNSTGHEIRHHQKSMFYHILDGYSTDSNYINAPRTSGKSTVCAVLYPIYKLLGYPDCKIAIVSERIDSSYVMKEEIDKLTNTDKFLSIFGNVIDTKNIHCYSIYDSSLVKNYDCIIFHDIGAHANDYKKTLELLDQYELFVHRGVEIIIVGTQLYYDDFYTKFRKITPIVNRLDI